MLTARARAKLLPASNASKRRSISPVKYPLLLLPHGRAGARLIFRVIVTRDVQGAMNDEASKLLALAHANALRILTRHFGTDVDIANRRQARRVATHSE